MIETHTCFTVRCDGCGDGCEVEDFEPHHPTAADARARALESEWTQDGARLFCRLCPPRATATAEQSPKPAPEWEPVPGQLAFDPLEGDGVHGADGSPAAEAAR